ncbi:uncharacterized protein LOC124936568 [Impatiens glandulifera]|uniref:uncharacterized protein LOC124936568 n=1 Tax=Impatiens glandulifera TaxID=253017 RepID=UPI001FB12D89|nr:uncharacterized protein LOC124936568 [Impatiens glandulifera]
MAAFIKIKRVTDPLNHEARARIVGGNVSSGSEHMITTHYEEDDTDSPCLSNLVNRFLEDEEEEDEFKNRANESDSDEDLLISPADDSAEELVTRIISSNVDSFRNLIMFNVSKAVTLSRSNDLDKSIFRRNVMAFLRGLGYNAGICKVKWESSGGLTGGCYEYIDVIRSDTGKRYIVDLDFVGEFEIARPTQNYSRILRLLPIVFVGRVEELKMIIHAMSNAARRSLKKRELSIPPWRKNRYMQNKWFGPYRRTSNVIPATATATLNPAFTAKCFCVGFDAVNDGTSRYSVK